jgi:predicted phosphodiesterase
VNIQLLSDLHLEAHPHWRAEPALGADALVLAGDVGSYQKGSLLTDDAFGLAQFSPLAGWPTPVFFVPGNHEYDGLDFDAAHLRLQATCQALGITWLERAVVHTPWKDKRGAPVRLVGTTLWSDFDGLAALEDSAAQALLQREKAFRAANHYLSKTGTTRDGAPFLAAQWRTQALLCQDWLRAQLDAPFDGSTVVVTHFAPSLRSADPRYGQTPGTAAFCNRLDPLFAQADLWVHGHLHAPSDYVQAGCRVVANPLGYVRKNEQARFAPTLLLSV